MKYSLKELNVAFDTIFTGHGKWPSSIGVPTKLGMAAIEIFVNPAVCEQSVADIIRAALVELNQVGYITYPD